MKRFLRHIRSRWACLAFVVLGALGVSGCKTSQKSQTTTNQEQQRQHQRPSRLDSIPERYPESIAMYGTPYRQYEPKRKLPDELRKEPVRKEKR